MEKERNLIRDRKNERILRDGFQEVFSFHGHKLSIRGTDYVTQSHHKFQRIFDHRKLGDTQFISWDSNNMLLWERDGLKNQYKFPGHQKNFITTLAYIPSLKIYIAAATDYTFKIFTRGLDLIGSMAHKERAVSSFIYNNANNNLLMCGSSGISTWSITTVTGADGPSYSVEKLNTFETCEGWMMKVIYELPTDRIYILNDRSVSVLSISGRNIIAKIENAHEAPLTHVCWYSRSLFYITCCARGLVRCWTLHHNRNEKEKDGGGKDTTSNGNGKTDIAHSDKDVHAEKKFSIVHTFRAHAKAVTGVVLHPVSGLLITTGLDGMVKVLNLEVLNELFFIKLEVGLTGVRSLKYEGMDHILLSQSDGTIRLWKISSFVKFFSMCSSAISNLTVSMAYKRGGEGNKTTDNTIAATSLGGKGVDAAVRIAVEESSQTQSRAIARSGFPNDTFVTATANQDIRLFRSGGTLLSRVEPDSLRHSDSVKECLYSPRQRMLFCLLDSGCISIFCAESAQASFLRTVGGGAASTGIGVCIALIDEFPSGAMRVVDRKWSTVDKDLRGNVPDADAEDEGHGHGLQELLVVGTSSGSLQCLDTMRDCNIVLVKQAHQGSILSIRYRQSRKELLIFGHSTNESIIQIKIWQLPDMTQTHELSDLRSISCTGASITQSMFGFGTETGFVRLFQPMSGGMSTPAEILRQGHQHDGKVTCLAFCDAANIFASTAMDCAIKIWDYEKRLLRTVSLHFPSLVVLFADNSGDVLLVQKAYILKVQRSDWDEGEDDMQLARENRDPWMQLDAGDDSELELDKMKEITSGHLISDVQGGNIIDINKAQKDAAAQLMFEFDQLKAGLERTDPVSALRKNITEENRNDYDNEEEEVRGTEISTILPETFHPPSHLIPHSLNVHRPRIRIQWGKATVARGVHGYIDNRREDSDAGSESTYSSRHSLGKHQAFYNRKHPLQSFESVSSSSDSSSSASSSSTLSHGSMLLQPSAPPNLAPSNTSLRVKQIIGYSHIVPGTVVRR
eukprot:gene1070-2098_t